MQKSIAILIGSLAKGGAEKQCILLALALSQHYKVTLFIQDINRSAKSNLDRVMVGNVTIVEVKGNLFKKVNILNKSILEENIFLLFSYLTMDNFLAGLVKLNNRKLNVIGGVRNCKLEAHKLWLTKLLHNNVFDATIFNNIDGMKSFIKKGFKKDKSRMIHNCIDLDKEEIDRESKDCLNVISVGRFVKQKDYFTALKVFKKLSEFYRGKINLKYNIVGYGILEHEIRDFIDQNKIKGVDLVVNPRPEIIKQLYIESHVYLCTSIFEGLSNTLLEAAFYKLPIVCTNVGDNTEIVLHESTGFVVNALDVNQLVAAMKLLINDDSLRTKFGEAGSIHVSESFSVNKFKENYLQLISSYTNC
ncbi:glycosyltransferase [Labilibacter marinus]|uniref:glycosyltransferase n=1 Tax=Labilibacter marinus TaxID=1477105 RepID=UPI000831781D|nr:glycosyltransferase [Labilibacter marinus]